MLKRTAFALSILLSGYLLGFYTRGVLLSGSRPPEAKGMEARSAAGLPPRNLERPTPTPEPVIEAQREPSLAPVVAMEPPLQPQPLEEASVEVDVPYDPANPVKRLQALEQLRYNVPGSAFTRLVGDVFDDSDDLSASMSAIMELSIEEGDRFNELLDEAVASICAIEAQAVQDRFEPNGDVVLVIPAFPESGSEIRSQLLAGIEGELGADRRHLFEMMLLQKPSSFGNFGGEPVAVRNPVFETVNGWREIVTIDIGKIVDAGTEDERFEGVRKAYQRDAFLKRYGHFFELEAEAP